MFSSPICAEEKESLCDMLSSFSSEAPSRRHGVQRAIVFVLVSLQFTGHTERASLFIKGGRQISLVSFFFVSRDAFSPHTLVSKTNVERIAAGRHLLLTNRRRQIN